MKEVKEEKKVETTEYNTSYEAWDGTKYEDLRKCITYELNNRFNKKELTNIIFYTVNSVNELIDFIRDYSSDNQWMADNYRAFCNIHLNDRDLTSCYAIEHNLERGIAEITNKVKFPLTFCIDEYIDNDDCPDEFYIMSIDKALSKSVDELEYAQMNFREINEFMQEIEGKK